MAAAPQPGPGRVPEAHVVIWVALAGAALGPLILLGDLPAWDEGHRDVARTGPFALWAVAIGLQSMTWALALPAIRAIARRWRTREAARSRELRFATGAVVLVAVLLAVTPALVQEIPETIPNRPLKTGLLNLIAFTVAAYAARAMWFAVAQLRTLPSGGAGDLDAVQRHRRLRADLETLLAILGILVSLAVIASAALRGLTISVDPDTALPAEAVISYGILLSVLLALIYVPAYLTLLGAGRALQDQLAPLLSVEHPGFTQRLDLRDRLGALLGLDVSATVSFRAGVAIVSPLLGSLTTLLPDLG